MSIDRSSDDVERNQVERIARIINEAADDIYWAVEHGRTYDEAALAREILATLPSAEQIRGEALEEAAKVAETFGDTDYQYGPAMSTRRKLAKAIRSLSPSVGED